MYGEKLYFGEVLSVILEFQNTLAASLKRGNTHQVVFWIWKKTIWW